MSVIIACWVLSGGAGVAAAPGKGDDGVESASGRRLGRGCCVYSPYLDVMYVMFVLC
jgi:hypothetical protein